MMLRIGYGRTTCDRNRAIAQKQSRFAGRNSAPEALIPTKGQFPTEGPFPRRRRIC